MIQLIFGFPFIGGHLLQDVSPDKQYDIIKTYAKCVAISDDVGKVVWISNSTLKKYFSKVEVGTK